MVCFMLLSSFAFAEAKTARELCIERNAASCEINGLKFFVTEEECPKGAKVLRSHGHENCDPIATPVVSKVTPPQVVEQVKPEMVTTTLLPDVPPESTQSFWGGPFLILALIGLVQGIISRVSVGPVIIVAVVMPVLATWGVLSGTPFPTGFVSNMEYVGFALLHTLLFSMAGWLVGTGIRLVSVKLIMKYL